LVYNPTDIKNERAKTMKIRKGVQKIYTEVAHSYEMINHIMTLGLDIRWRKKAAREASRKGGSLWLDICSGTGEMAGYLSAFSDGSIKIFAVDFSLPMMQKLMQKDYAFNLFPVIAEAAVLPFPDDSFDLLTISFATRNLNPRKEILESYIEEFRRVLKPGGRFVNLETSQPSIRIIKWLFHFYVEGIVKPLGGILSGSRSGYRYLSYTIPRFYGPDEFADILLKSGFSDVEYRTFLFGISALHVATK
jgi:demethylmenaquinone methyltransferase/2-methoxy-6-polyprenyl-1,4-benzoquinol methylase